MTPNFILSMPAQSVASQVMEDLHDLTLQEMCRACIAQADIIMDLVREGVMDGVMDGTIEGATQSVDVPLNQSPEQWRFTGVHLHRAKVALRLQRDLGVNFAGAALVLQLMDELAVLRQQIRK